MGRETQRTRRGVVRVAILGALLAGCGAVELPEERFYRLESPRPEATPEAFAGILRVDRLTVAPHLRGDRLMVSEGAVLVRPYRFHRWAGPLESLVQEALVTGLQRSGAFARVLGPGDAGGEELLLRGRVLELQQHVAETHSTARVGLDLELIDRRRGEVVFRSEFSRDVAVDEPHPEAVVGALSRALGEIVGSVATRAGEHALAAAPGN